ncbi:MAG: peptide chain release factor N(5)-glutamine methyltransferase [Gemmatimonadaceae bacterium]
MNDAGCRVPAVGGRVAPGTIGCLVEQLASSLGAAGVHDSLAEARDIVAAVLDVPRLWPSVNRDAIVEDATRAAALAAARLRARGAPFAYAVGKAAFRHLTLDVDERVLIPRPETEMLVEAVLTRVRDGVAVDIGTGSGAIAIALATEGRYERVIATDVSLGALAVARANAERLATGARAAPIELRHGSLLAPLAGVRARVVVSNPPYIATGEATSLPRGVRDWEPAVALFSGPDGMMATARIIDGATAILEAGGLLALEVDARRAPLAAELAMANGGYRDVAIALDLAGRARYLFATRTPTRTS